MADGGLLLVVLIMLYCAFRAVRSAQLLNSALWLAATSALLSLLLYALQAPEVSALELSVGAGLVTVLFIFTLSLSDFIPTVPRSAIPMRLALTLVLAFAIPLAVIIALLLPSLQPVPRADTGSIPFGDMFWQQRGLDVMTQILMIFAGALCILALIGGSSILKQHRQNGSQSNSNNSSRSRLLSLKDNASEILENARLKVWMLIY